MVIGDVKSRSSLNTAGEFSEKGLAGCERFWFFVVCVFEILLLAEFNKNQKQC